MRAAAWVRTLGRDASSVAGDERSLRGFLAYCQGTLLAPLLAPSPVTLALLDAEKRRAMGLAPAVTSALESHRAAHGSLRAFMDWCSVAATVAADVERALADVGEEESAALGAAAELGVDAAPAEAPAAAAAPAAAPAAAEAAGGGLGEAAAALAAGPHAHALRARAYAAELRALHSALVALLQASLDAATGALLEKAEDYSGEAKGVRELLCVDAFEVGAEAASASPAGVRLAPGPFVRRRNAGEVVIWCSLTGTRINRNPKPFSGPSVEAEFQKGCLGIATNVAVRVSTLLTALESVPGGSASGSASVGGSGKAKARPKSAGGMPRAAAAAGGSQEEGKEGGSEGAAGSSSGASEAAEGKEGAAEEGKEGKEGEGSAAEAPAAAPRPAAPAPAPAPAPASVPLRPLGGWLCLDQLLMPPPNSGIRGWAMTAAALPPPGGAAALPHPLLRMEHPAASNASAASTTSVKVKWHLPRHIVTGPLELVCPPPSSGSAGAPPHPRALLPGRWLPERSEWSTDGVADAVFHAPTRTLQFAATAFAPHALLQPRAVDLPFQSWVLAPALAPALAGAAGAAGGDQPPQHAATLALTTARGLTVRLHVSGAGCRLLAPRLPALAHLTGGGEGEEEEGGGSAAGRSGSSSGSGSGSGSSGGEHPGGATAWEPLPAAPCLPPGQMLAALRACGLHLAPSDSDAPAAAALLGAESSARALAPLLPRCTEAALHADLAHACASFRLEGCSGRGYAAGVAPADPSDAPPNAHAPLLAQVRALETLEPAGAGSSAWRSGATASLRLRIVQDSGVPRGFKVSAAPEGAGAGSAGGGAGVAHAALDTCLLASASPEASAWLAAAPPAFTETVRRLLCLVRPLNFSA